MWRKFFYRFKINEMGFQFKREYAAFICLLFSAFFAPFSLPASRVFAGLSLILLIIFAFDEEKKPRFPLVAWLWLVFGVITVFVTYLGINPDIGIPKLMQLVWWFIIPVTATLANNAKRRWLLVECLVIGTVVLAIRTFIQIPLKALKFMEGGIATSFAAGIIHAGSMTDAQRAMAGLLLALSLLIKEWENAKTRKILLAVVFLIAGALVINFKRGSWFAAIFCVVFFLARYINRRGWLILVLLFAVFINIPIVKARLLSLQHEFYEASGGRWLMWRKIAPAIIADYPEGVGWHSLTSEWMKEIDERVEPNRNHLHSNILEVLVETGWAGFIVYSIWMLKSFFDALGFRIFSAGSPEYQCAGGVYFALLALLLNGIVEYNFGDSEIIMLYAFLMGTASAGVDSFVGYGSKKKAKEVLSRPVI